MTVTQRSSHREIVASLAGARKSNRGAPPYSRWINRPLGRHLAATCFRLGLTPNQISLVSAACTLAGIVVLAVAPPAWRWSVLVTVLLVLGYGLDSADGQVARLRGGGSPAGEWLDHVFDSAKASAFHVAVAVLWFRHYDVPDGMLLIPLGFSIVAAVFFFAMILTDMLRRIDRAAGGGSADAKASLDPTERAPVLRSLIVLPNDYGVLCLVMLLIPVQDAFVTVYTALFAANALFLAVGAKRWFTEMRTLGRPRPTTPVP